MPDISMPQVSHLLGNWSDLNKAQLCYTTHVSVPVLIVLFPKHVSFENKGFLPIDITPLQYSCRENPIDRGAW